MPDETQKEGAEPLASLPEARETVRESSVPLAAVEDPPEEQEQTVPAESLLERAQRLGYWGTPQDK